MEFFVIQIKRGKYRFSRFDVGVDEDEFSYHPKPTRNSLLNLLSVCEDENEGSRGKGRSVKKDADEMNNMKWRDFQLQEEFTLYNVEVTESSSLFDRYHNRRMERRKIELPSEKLVEILEEDLVGVTANVFTASTNPRDKVDLVVASLTLPDVSGPKAAQYEKQRAFNAHLAFLCCCGHEILKNPVCDCQAADGQCSIPCIYKKTPKGGLFVHQIRVLYGQSIYLVF